MKVPMDAIRRTSTLRRVATTASLAALLLVPGAAEAKPKAKPPVITSVKPMNATVGDTLVIQGRNFRKGKGRNSIGFKRSGAAVVFLKSDLSTKRTMSVKLTAKLNKVLYGGQPGVFRLRVLAGRFGKRYTSVKLSPTIAPKVKGDDPAGPNDPANPSDPANPETPKFDPAGPEGDCDGDKVLNKNESGDLDNDLLSDAMENQLGTDGCKADTDGDTVIDSYEYKSAVDLNDDEYQAPNVAIPYPGARPYPNPLAADADLDFDGDSLTLAEEHSLWSKQGGRAADETPASFAAKHLSYSDGLQHSVYRVTGDGHRVPDLAVAGYDKRAQFLSWAASTGYLNVTPPALGFWTVASGAVDIRDVNRDGTVDTGCGGEETQFDFDCNGFLADDERDEDADGLTNYDETHGRAGAGWWTSCYTQEEPYDIPYAGTDLANPDSDGDGIRDGADDQDHDDLPNMMELSRFDASRGQVWDSVPYPNGFNDTKGQTCKPLDGLDPEVPRHSANYGKVNPFDPCDPAPNSRTCERHPEFGTAADPNWWALS